MTAIRSIAPERGGYILATDDGRELRIRTGLDPRDDSIGRALLAYMGAHPGELVALDEAVPK
jgi:hypothetical protein